MEASGASSITPEMAIARLTGKEFRTALEEARQTHARYVRERNSKHPRASQIDYWRGRWDGQVKLLAVQGGFEISSEEGDLLEFTALLLDHLRETAPVLH